jgi:hypothetical protein
MAHHGEWSFAVRKWAIAILVVASTYALVFTMVIEPHEWLVAVTFIVAHLIAAEVVVAGHKRK